MGPERRVRPHRPRRVPHAATRRPTCARRPATRSSSTPSASARSSARPATTSPTLGSQIGGRRRAGGRLDPQPQRPPGRSAAAPEHRRSRRVAGGTAARRGPDGGPEVRRRVGPRGVGRSRDRLERVASVAVTAELLQPHRLPDAVRAARRTSPVHDSHARRTHATLPSACARGTIATRAPLDKPTSTIYRYTSSITQRKERDMSHDETARPWPFIARWAMMKGVADGRGRAGAWITSSAWPRCASSAAAPFGAGRRSGRTRPDRFGGGRGRRRRGDVRTGAAAAAGRGGPQRLPADADDRGAQRRAVAPEPRLGLPDAGPARGRGPDPGVERDGAKLFEITDAGPRAPRRARGRAGPMGRPDEDPAARTLAELALAGASRSAKAAWQVGHAGDERADEHALRGADRDAPGAATGSSPRTTTTAGSRGREAPDRRNVSDDGHDGRNGTSGPPAIDVRGLVKNYGEVEAVRGVDFEVATGEVFGFLGPNGAGKTTTINMLCTLVKPTAGSAQRGRPRRRHASATTCAATSGWCSRTRRWTAT